MRVLTFQDIFMLLYQTLHDTFHAFFYETLWIRLHYPWL